MKRAWSAQVVSLAALVWVAFAVPIGACSGNGGSTSAIPPDDLPPGGDPTPSAEPPTVIVYGAGGVEHVVQVELATTNRTRSRGLMFRESLADDRGMLFIFPRDRVQSFYMRNTLIPLDMIFIRADLTIAGIVENAEPLTETSRTVGVPSRYVLEVNGGWTAKRGVQEDSVVRFEHVLLDAE